MGQGVSGEQTQVQKFYQTVILPDEREFLFSEALDHVRILEPGSITGEPAVLVEDGKVMVEHEWARRMFEECTSE